MEGGHGVGASRCHLLDGPPPASTPPVAPHPIELRHPASKESLQDLGFLVLPQAATPFLLPTEPSSFSNPLTGISCEKYISKTWINEEVGTSGPKASSDHSSACKDGDNSWWRSSNSMEKGKVKMRRKMREPRFCFQTRSDVDVLEDGYKWRKYGQKVVKNSLHPRSYYRCTNSNCRVKKRVERLSEDCRMVVTTYEGRHTHSPCDDANSSGHECFSSF